MNWDEVASAIRSELGSRDLKEPRLRLSALQKVGDMLAELYPQFRQNPEILLNAEQIVSADLARHKKNGRLNGAEKSVLRQIYKHLRSAQRRN